MDKLIPYLKVSTHYNTLSIGVGKTKPREVKYYEASIYIADGGKISINGKFYDCEKYWIRFNRPGDIVYSIPHFTCLTVKFGFKGHQSVSNGIIDNIDSFFYGSGKIVTLFEKIIAHYKSGKDLDRLLICSYLLKLIAEFYKACASQNSYSDVVSLCVSYMENNFSQKITLDTLGMLTGYSPLHLSRIFLKETGQTPHQFVTDARMEYAKDKLTETNEKIREIANECGFSSESHFKAFFKRTTGKTPGMYRKYMQLSI